MATQSEILAFAAAIESERMKGYYSAASGLPDPKMTVEFGPKYARIVKNDHGRSVFCFVEIATGNIMMAAGWKAPAKNHPRGTIHTPTHGVEFVGKYGPAYMSDIKAAQKAG